MRTNLSKYSTKTAVWLYYYIRIATLLVCFYSASASAQVFDLTVVPTHESCPGGGAMAFTVANANSTVPVNFKVYVLPNTTTPVSDNSSYSITGLPHGNYLVVASQNINGTIVSDQENVVIENHTVAISYSIEGNNSYCGPDGSITVTVTSGTAATYEIISGPVLKAPQASNILTGLTAGTYVIRVVDNCGSGEVTTHILFSDGPILEIDSPTLPDQILPDCGHTTLSNAILTTNGVDITYPLQVVFTIYPPGGGSPIVFTKTVENGADEQAVAAVVIPLYHDTDYYYDIRVTDPCGTVYEDLNILIHPKINAIPVFDDIGCGLKSLIISPTKYIPPYSIVFTSVPAGFDPEIFNVQHPGPFTDEDVRYGSPINPLPFGNYTYTLTDSCGHSVTRSAEYTDPQTEPVASVFNADCTGEPGKVEIGIAGFVIETGIITEAPDGYTPPLPHDVSGGVDSEGVLKVENLIPGEYVITVTDTCGNTWPPVYFEIGSSPGNVSPGLARPDCTPGKGAVTINAAGGVMEVVKITGAPTGFTHPLPYDASYNISNVDHVFYMDELPPGTYTFLLDTSCETGITRTVTVPAYTTTVNDFEMKRHCGSFDLTINHNSNAVAFLSFWLQRYNPGTNTWGHPITGVSEPSGENSPFDVDNAIQLTNNTTLYSLMQTGQFRVMKCFQSFPSGSVSTRKLCSEQIQEFEFLDDLQIVDIFSLTCSGAIGDVQIDVEGVSPLNFELVSKNGDDTFYVNNGENNIFPALESAYYKVRVTDPCGNLRAVTFNVADLPSMVNATRPDDIELCDSDGNGTEEFDLSQLDDTIRDGQDASLVAITYHISQDDANTGDNPLPIPYTTVSVTLYARALYNNISACTATTSFDVIVNPAPDLQMEELWTGCEGTPLTITADAGYERYEWSGGQNTPSIIVTENGTHTIKVTNEFGCESEKTIQVSFSPLPSISRIITEDWTDSSNVITVVMNNPSIASFEYSLDGINYQASNIFTGLPSGPYLIYVRDIFDCGIAQMPAFLLTYPKFFTPNGDGVNETWRIRFSVMEPDMLIYIYDRYGKLITGFGSDSLGWDGTLNGKPLPATDYWFVVKRQNGEELKGHFSMMR
jgi:gliding motility-associated-like protein